MISNIELNAMAIDLRVRLGVDVNSPVDIFAIASGIPGLTLVHYPLGERISGMCMKAEGANVIAINSAMSYGRQRFSLAHELYHLYYDTDAGMSISAKKFEADNEHEKVADQFASYFLVPYGALRSIMRSEDSAGREISVKTVIRIEQLFGMSHQAMLWRLVGEGYLTREQADTMKGSVMGVAKSLGYDERLYLPTVESKQRRTYGNYIFQAETLKERGIISNGKYEELLLDAFRHDIVFGDDEEGGDVDD